MDHIEFRPPLAARVLVGVFCGGFDCALLIEGIVQGTKNADAGGIVLGVLLMTAVAALGWRLARQAAIISQEGCRRFLNPVLNMLLQSPSEQQLVLD